MNYEDRLAVAGRIHDNWWEVDLYPPTNEILEMREEYDVLLEKIERHNKSFKLLKPWRMLWLRIRTKWFVSQFGKYYAPLRAH